MNVPPDPPVSKGKLLIAAYRADRLAQRPVLRTSLLQTHLPRQAVRGSIAPAAEPEPAILAQAPAIPIAALPEPEDETLVSADPANSTPAAPVADPAAEQPSNDTVAEEMAGGTETAVDDPPLAEIGFGPGMLIRLSQLGVQTTGDLAQADAAVLRAALGDISRLVDVEAWIASARLAASAQSVPSRRMSRIGQ